MAHSAIFSSLFFRVYGILWALVRPWLRRNKRLKDGWHERLVPKDWCDQRDLWIQAASGGEAKLVISILQALPAGVHLRVLACTWTRQGKEVLEASLPNMVLSHPGLEVLVRFAPLDTPTIAGRAVGMARPRALILLETELWPALLGACAEQGVPAQIINGRISKTTVELYRILLPLLGAAPLRTLHSISAMSNEDAARFRQIFGQDTNIPCRISTMPNIKFDQAAEALTSGISASFPPVPVFARTSNMLLLASVREQEEKLLAPLLDKLLKAQPEVCIVVAPRHMHRVQAWRERLHDLGLQPLLASQQEKHTITHGRVMVWDMFGNLPQLYAVARAVFVGGSFGLGGQNFLEALSTGLVPCTGPSLEHFRWALGENNPPSLSEAGLLHICRNSRELLEKLIEQLRQNQNQASREAVRARFRSWLRPHCGGSMQAAQVLLEAMGKE